MFQSCSCNVAQHVAQCCATRCATSEQLGEYCTDRAEINVLAVLAYAEYNRICFKVVAATLRNMLRSVARHDARHRNNSVNTARIKVKLISWRFWHTLNTIGHVSKSWLQRRAVSRDTMRDIDISRGIVHASS